MQLYLYIIPLVRQRADATQRTFRGVSPTTQLCNVVVLKQCRCRVTGRAVAPESGPVFPVVEDDKTTTNVNIDVKKNVFL